MIKSHFRTFLDPDELVGAVRPAKAQLTVTQRGRFAAEYAGIELDRIWIKQASETLSRVAHLELPHDRTFFAFLPVPTSGIFVSGEEITRNTIVRHGLGRIYYQKSLGQTTWANLSVRNEELAAICAEVMRDCSDPGETRTFRPTGSAMQRLLRVVRRALLAASNSPDVLGHSGASRGLGNALIEALAGCLTDAAMKASANRVQNHSSIIARFDEAIRAYPAIPLFLPDVCNVIGVAPRTLHTAFTQQTGMSAKSFLTMRRLNQVRRALSFEGSEYATVTKAATDHGFWELGRFSVAYKQLFGESPSTTLKRRMAQAGQFLDNFGGAAEPPL